MSNSSTKEEPLKSVAEETAYRQKYGEDEEQAARAEHGLLIDGVPYSKVYDQCFSFCERKGLSTTGDVYATVRKYFEENGIRSLTKKARGKL